MPREQAPHRALHVRLEAGDKAREHRGAVRFLSEQRVHPLGGEIGLVEQGRVGVSTAAALPLDRALLVEPDEDREDCGVGEVAPEAAAHLFGGEGLVGRPEHGEHLGFQCPACSPHPVPSPAPLCYYSTVVCVGDVPAVSVLSHLLAPLLHLAAWQVYLLVGVLAFGEAAVLLGFVLPGETAVILGGVASRVGHAHLAVIVPLVVAAAVLGDSVGYEIGRRIGPRLLNWRLVRARSAPFDAARAFLDRRGARAVFIGRFTVFLRTVIPGLAGMSGLSYRRFFVANASGGVIWAIGYSVLGYAIGTAYQSVERYSTIGSSVLLALIVLAVVLGRLRSRRRERSLLDAALGQGAGGDTAPVVGAEALDS